MNVNPTVVANDLGDDEEQVLPVETFVPYEPPSKWAERYRRSQPHPDPLVITRALASVDRPQIDYDMHRELDCLWVGKRAPLSAAQLEAVLLCCQSHEQRLPDGSRRGFLLGDAAGVGKGRTIAGILLENWYRGRRKALWLSVSWDLEVDATRDITDVCSSGLADIPPLYSLRKLLKSHNLATVPSSIKDDACLNAQHVDVASHLSGPGIREGIIFSTYSTFIAGGSAAPPMTSQTQAVAPEEQETEDELMDYDDVLFGLSKPSRGAVNGQPPRFTSRFAQLLAWLGPATHSCVIFDEAHRGKNYLMPKAPARSTELPLDPVDEEAIQERDAYGGAGIFPGYKAKRRPWTPSTPVPDAGTNHKAGTRTGRAILEFQLRNPLARVVYVTATGGYEARHLAHMCRLGLWQPPALASLIGTSSDNVTVDTTGSALALHHPPLQLGPHAVKYPFSSFKSFYGAMMEGGISAFEVCAGHLKLMGQYCSRLLSYEETTFEIVEIPVTDEFAQRFDAATDMWQRVHRAFEFASEYQGTSEALSADKVRELALPTIVDDPGLQLPEWFRSYVRSAPESRRASRMMKAVFWSAHQRFFKQMSMAAKVPRIAEITLDALQSIDRRSGEPHCVVIGLQSTGEANARRRYALKGSNLSGLSGGVAAGFSSSGAESASKRKRRTKGPPASAQASADGVEPGDGEDDDAEFDSAPKDTLRYLVEKWFPFVPIPLSVFWAFGLQNLVASEERVTPNRTDHSVKAYEESWIFIAQLRWALIRGIETMDLPPNPLDDFIERVGGPTVVSEMTGRYTQQVRRDQLPEAHSQYLRRDDPRGSARVTVQRDELKPGVLPGRLNVSEKNDFQSGGKYVAIISSAASSGISLHAERREAVLNHRRRVHITLEPPWSADAATQQFGRTHRSNMTSAPHYVFPISDIAGERRFAAAVGSRLRALGALCRGDRHAVGTNDLSIFDVFGDKGVWSLDRMYRTLLQEIDPGEKVVADLSFLAEFGGTVEASLRTSSLDFTAKRGNASASKHSTLAKQSLRFADISDFEAHARGWLVDMGLATTGGFKLLLPHADSFWWSAPAAAHGLTALTASHGKISCLFPQPQTSRLVSLLLRDVLLHSTPLDVLPRDGDVCDDEPTSSVRPIDLTGTDEYPKARIEMSPEDKRDVRRFLNRIIGLRLQEQAALFAYFSATFEAVTKELRANGGLDEGIRSIGGSEKFGGAMLTVVDGELVAKHVSITEYVPPGSTSDCTYYYRFDCDRGIPWEYACGILKRAKDRTQSFPGAGEGVSPRGSARVLRTGSWLGRRNSVGRRQLDAALPKWPSSRKMRAAASVPPRRAAAVTGDDGDAECDIIDLVDEDDDAGPISAQLHQRPSVESPTTPQSAISVCSGTTIAESTALFSNVLASDAMDAGTTVGKELRLSAPRVEIDENIVLDLTASSDASSYTTAKAEAVSTIENEHVPPDYNDVEPYKVKGAALTRLITPEEQMPYTGFWERKSGSDSASGRVTSFWNIDIMLVIEEVDASHPTRRNLVRYQPDTGLTFAAAKRLTPEVLRTEFVLMEDGDEVYSRWNAVYDESRNKCKHQRRCEPCRDVAACSVGKRLIEHHLLVGAMLPMWNYVRNKAIAAIQAERDELESLDDIRDSINRKRKRVRSQLAVTHVNLKNGTSLLGLLLPYKIANKIMDPLRTYYRPTLTSLPVTSREPDNDSQQEPQLLTGIRQSLYPGPEQTTSYVSPGFSTLFMPIMPFVSMWSDNSFASLQ